MTTTEPTHWVKSSYSSNGGTCVEWAPSNVPATQLVPIRDSKNPSGPSLMVSTSAWAGLIALARTADV
ncbi:DUF397 domain-containing protein [Streptomyces amakusaensis]|uniref:DUF397 domain-containing protein n=1 Tax=Streptomyces amakusaensis TaxID=67271 RepID=A0ABW0ARG4_9ACTN